jgi:hypothetical protein
MGLFSNNPNVYMNKERLYEPNQQTSRSDQLSELMEEQQKANIALRDTLMQALLETEGVVKQDMTNRFEKNDTVYRQISLQLQEQLALQKQMAKQISQQENFQAGILGRLNNQEALTEKISRQLNHIRSILFERTNYLAEKIDAGYKVTSSYVYKLMTSSDKPLTFLMMNNKKKEENPIQKEES